MKQRRLRRIGSGFGKQVLAQLMVRRRRGGSTPADLSSLSTRSVALVKLDGIGDFVLATGLLHLIHESLPPENVSLFCCQPVGILARHQFPDWQVQELGLRNSLWRVGLQRHLSTYPNFDLLVDLRASRALADSLVTSWLPADKKVGFANQQPRKEFRFWREGALFNELLVSTSIRTSDACQEILNFRSMADYLFPDRSSCCQLLPKLNVSEHQQHKLSSELLKDFDLDLTRPFLLVCPGSLQTIKEYPTDKLAKVVASVASTNSLPVIVTGGKGDVRTTRPLTNSLRNTPNVSDLTGQLNLEEHVVLTSMAKAVLAMDSATAHIAGALNRPAVVLLGGGYPGVFGPWGQSKQFRWLQNRVYCYGCGWHCIRERPVCVHDIPAESIELNLNEVLSV